eukprot:65217_1
MYSLFWILWFIMQLQAQFKASLGEYPQENRILVPESTHRWKDRAIAYLWIVTCKDADCEMDQWSKRIDYNKYTKHYNKEHKQSWGNDGTISNVLNIMNHIRVVSIWVKQNDIDVDAKQRHMYHEYRFVNSDNLALLEADDGLVLGNQPDAESNKVQ